MIAAANLLRFKTNHNNAEMKHSLVQGRHLPGRELQDKTMKQYKPNVYNTESSSLTFNSRRSELQDHVWTREKSRKLAEAEGIQLTDDHWAVITYLRKRYLKQGLPRHARVLAKALKEKFTAEGGTKYLYRLFSGGPVTQGSRLANLSSPSSTTDWSFGTNY
jgi:tRNA 2-thiouridine synthesizing protein E